MTYKEWCEAFAPSIRTSKKLLKKACALNKFKLDEDKWSRYKEGISGIFAYLDTLIPERAVK